MFESQDIHTQANIQLATKLNHHILNVPLFKNERLGRIKIKQRYRDRFNKTQLQMNTESKNKRYDNVSDFDLSTNHQSNFKSTQKDQQLIRSMTTNNHTRSFRKSQKKKLILNVNGPTGNTVKLDQPSQQQIMKQMRSTYREIEKKNNKGPFEIKYMQNWLNDILTQYCYEQKFDPTIKNPALKKFQIDRNSFLSKGINHEKIDRIYRSVFVYSIGFNNLLQELIQCTQSTSIRKIIWKVYAMLLQFCAKGQFQTMVGQIERDNQKKIQIMKQQIQKRQKMIDQSEQNDRERNIKIHKEIKKLKEQNEHLLNQKAIIQEDFKQADQAFNQQVALRLKFQHKINQIHGIHRELGIKHMRLYEDFNINKSDYSKLVQQRLKVTNKIQELLLKIVQLKQQNERLKFQLTQKKKNIQNYQNQLQFFNQKLNASDAKSQIQFSLEKSKQREINLLKFEVSNANGIISLKQNALNDQYKQIELLIQQNKNMFKKIQEQKTKIQEITSVQYDIELTTLNVKTNFQILDGKYKAKVIQCNKLKDQNQKLIDRVLNNEAELNLALQKISLLNNDIQNYIKNIQLMRKSKNSIEQQMLSLKQKNQTMTELIVKKQALQLQLTKKLNETTMELMVTKTELSDTQVRMKFLDDSFKHETNILSKKYDKVKMQRDQLLRKYTQASDELKILESQNQKYKRQELQLKIKLRDQIYERTNLELKYKQSLLVMQEEGRYIKQLNISMSQLKQQKESFRRQLKSTQFVLQQKSQQYKKQILMINNQLEIMKQKIQRKNEWINPMYYEDVLSQLSQIKNKYINLCVQHERMNQQNILKQKSLNYELKLLKTIFEEEKIKFNDEYDKKIKLIKQENQTLKSQFQIIKSQNIELQNKILKYEQFFKVSDNPKQQALLRTIKQQSEQLQKLGLQNLALQDQNKQIHNQLESMNKQIANLNDEIEKTKNIILNMENQLKVLNDLKNENIELKRRLQQAGQNYSSIREGGGLQSTKYKKNKIEQTDIIDQQQLQPNSLLRRPQEKLNELPITRKRQNDHSQSEIIQKRQSQNRSVVIKDQSKRKQIVRKIQGAFNYYNKMSR